MSFKTTNDYQAHISSPYTLSPYFYCYIKSSESFQSPISFEEPFQSPISFEEPFPSPLPFKNSFQSATSFKKPFQLPTSFKKSFAASNEDIQPKRKSTTHLHREKHRHHPNIITPQSYQSTFFTKTIPTVFDNRMMKNIYRSDSTKNVEHKRLNKQLSLQKSASAFQQRETHVERQQWPFTPSIDEYCFTLRNQADTISSEELADILNQITNILKSFNNQEQQPLPVLIDILIALIYVRPPILASVSQHEFFSMLQISFIDILRQWHRLASLPDDQSFMFYTMAKLLTIVIDNVDNINLLPSWFSDLRLFEVIADCLTDMANSRKFLDHRNKHQLKHFTRLIDTYINYQQRITDENQSNKDILLPLLHPIFHCLTSSHFINTFTNISIDTKSMTTIEKFFLIKCPAFIISYNGSRLEQTMKNLLSTMLPQYVTLLNKLVPSARNWSQSVIRCVQYLLKTINHGANQFPINAKLVSGHLPLIDHVLKLLDEPIFYNNLSETLSNVQMNFVYIAISFLVNMISEPEILAHIKQSQVTRIFLRLTSCEYEPLVFNVYTLLAYTTHEEDIKAMKNPGRFFATIIESLKTALNQKPEKRSQIEQLLETLRGLVQHDQMKDEVIKQNALPFLLECTNKLSGRALVIVFEILLCLAFIEGIAGALRANTAFVEKIRTTAEDNTNEPLKKAAGGLVWKLIQEPEFLEKVVKQEEKEEAEIDETFTTTEVVITPDGREQVVTKTRRGSPTPTERSYQYDVMISYCHADKELTYKIHKFLIDQGLKVWIDLDSMYGPAMSAMADAVENSEFVILCMSDAYKQSTYCQAEAEYAFKCKRRLIPLVMRQGYKPDGWLGFMIGSRMYIDFTRYDFDVACEKVVTEMNLQRRQTIPTIVIDPLEQKTTTEIVPVSSKDVQEKRKKSTEHRVKRPSITKDVISSVIKRRQSKLEYLEKPIHQWTESDVLDFLMANTLNQLVPLCDGMNGRAFIQLYKICSAKSLRAYSVLKDELKSLNNTKLSLGVYSRFLSLMEEILSSPPSPPPTPPPPLQPSSIPPAILPSITPSLPPSLPPPLPLPPPVVVQSPTIDYSLVLPTCIPFVPASDPNMPYDFIITTDASPYETLRMVERYGSQLQFLDHLRRRITNMS